MTRTHWFPACCLGLLIALAGSRVALAQNEEDRPRFLLTSGGPVAPTWALTFSPDGQRLLAAGGDKLTRIWDLRRDEDGRTRTELGQRVYWRIARGIRGFLYALDVSPDGKLLAMGGISADDANGDISIYELGTGNLIQVLGTPRGEDQHRSGVVSLKFSPDGKRLASASQDGQLRVWDSENWESVQLQKGDGQLRDYRPLAFLSTSLLAAPAHAGKTVEGQVSYPDWRVAIHDVTSGRKSPKVLKQSHKGAVFAIAKDPTSRTWATSDAIGNIYLWEGGTGVRRLRQGAVARSLCFGKGYLFAATLRSEDTPARLEMWNIESRTKLDQYDTAISTGAFCCAASADGNYVATLDGDRNEVMLWSLTGRESSSTKPLRDGKITRLSGNGKTVWKAAFEDARGSYRLGVGDKLKEAGELEFGDYGAVNRIFDLENFEVDEAGGTEIQWRRPNSGAEQWKIVRLPEGAGYVLELRHNGQSAAKIELDKTYQGRARSYCWLTNPAGQVYGVAIGTDKQHGIFVYSVSRRGPPRLLRYFRDHRGWVTSLSVSADGKYLASASTDQTVKIWSLEGIQAAGDEFSQETVWGAVFKVQGEHLVVDSRLKAGIAASRGLKPDDLIPMLKYDEEGKEERTTDARKMLEVLEQNRPWQSLRVSYRAPDDRRSKRVNIVPGWEPLLTLYLDRQNNWAAWTPQGYYEASAVGDEMFGWIINGGRFDQPQFVRANRLRKDLENPEVIRGLLETGNLPDALDTANQAVPDRVQEQVSQAVQWQPKVEIEKPEYNQQFGQEEPIEIIARVQFADQPSIDRYDVRCYVNSVPLPSPNIVRVDEITRAYRWQTDAVSSRNRIKVLAEGEYTGPDTSFVSDTVFARAQMPPRQYRLHLASLAGNEYRGLDNLQGTQDARKLSQALAKAAGPFYQMGKQTLLEGPQVTRQRVQAQVEQLKKDLEQLEPSDLLVVYAAGHGVEYQAEYYFLPASPEYDYAAGDFGDAVRNYGIPWELMRQFCEVRCRKLFLIDTCRDPADYFTGENVAKATIRPLRESDSLIVTATTSGNKAFERREGGGIFTHSIIESLDGPADGHARNVPRPPEKDGRVDIDEVTGYVDKRVVDMQQKLLEETPTLRRLNPGFGRQRPWVSDTTIGDPIRLSRYRDQ